VGAQRVRGRQWILRWPVVLPAYLRLHLNRAEVAQPKKELY